MVTAMQTTSTTQQVITGKSEAMQHATRTPLLRSAPKNPASRKSAGFTLIELMVVVAIVAILSAIAIPAYQRQIMQSRRTSAKTALFDLSGREEKYYAANNYYPASLSSVGYSTVDSTGALQVPNNTNEDYYSVTIAVNAATSTTPASYKATATTVGNQLNDSCGNFSITDLGVQGATGTNSGTGSGCW
jgi:type IV pilus assembly protein PilE